MSTPTSSAGGGGDNPLPQQRGRPRGIKPGGLAGLFGGSNGGLKSAVKLVQSQPAAAVPGTAAAPNGVQVIPIPPASPQIENGANSPTAALTSKLEAAMNGTAVAAAATAIAPEPKQSVAVATASVASSDRRSQRAPATPPIAATVTPQRSTPQPARIDTPPAAALTPPTAARGLATTPVASATRQSAARRVSTESEIALLLSAHSGHARTVRQLLAAAAASTSAAGTLNVNVRDRRGCTPLALCVQTICTLPPETDSEADGVPIAAVSAAAVPNTGTVASPPPAPAVGSSKRAPSPLPPRRLPPSPLPSSAAAAPPATPSNRAAAPTAVGVAAIRSPAATAPPSAGTSAAASAAAAHISKARDLLDIAQCLIWSGAALSESTIVLPLVRARKWRTLQFILATSRAAAKAGVAPTDANADAVGMMPSAANCIELLAAAHDSDSSFAAGSSGDEKSGAHRLVRYRTVINDCDPATGYTALMFAIRYRHHLSPSWQPVLSNLVRFGAFVQRTHRNDSPRTQPNSLEIALAAEIEDREAAAANDAAALKSPLRSPIPSPAVHSRALQLNSPLAIGTRHTPQPSIVTDPTATPSRSATASASGGSASNWRWPLLTALLTEMDPTRDSDVSESGGGARHLSSSLFVTLATIGAVQPLRVALERRLIADLNARVPYPLAVLTSAIAAAKKRVAPTTPSADHKHASPAAAASGGRTSITALEACFLSDSPIRCSGVVSCAIALLQFGASFDAAAIAGDPALTRKLYFWAAASRRADVLSACWARGVDIDTRYITSAGASAASKSRHRPKQQSAAVLSSPAANGTAVTRNGSKPDESALSRTPPLQSRSSFSTPNGSAAAVRRVRSRWFGTLAIEHEQTALSVVAMMAGGGVGAGGGVLPRCDDETGASIPASELLIARLIQRGASVHAIDSRRRSVVWYAASAVVHAFQTELANGPTTIQSVMLVPPSPAHRLSVASVPATPSQSDSKYPSRRGSLSISSGTTVTTTATAFDSACKVLQFVTEAGGDLFAVDDTGHSPFALLRSALATATAATAATSGSAPPSASPAAVSPASAAAAALKNRLSGVVQDLLLWNETGCVRAESQHIALAAVIQHCVATAPPATAATEPAIITASSWTIALLVASYLPQYPLPLSGESTSVLYELHSSSMTITDDATAAPLLAVPTPAILHAHYRALMQSYQRIAMPLILSDLESADSYRQRSAVEPLFLVWLATATPPQPAASAADSKTATGSTLAIATTLTTATTYSASALPPFLHSEVCARALPALLSVLEHPQTGVSLRSHILTGLTRLCICEPNVRELILRTELVTVIGRLYVALPDPEPSPELEPEPEPATSGGGGPPRSMFSRAKSVAHPSTAALARSPITFFGRSVSAAAYDSAAQSSASSSAVMAASDRLAVLTAICSLCSALIGTHATGTVAVTPLTMSLLPLLFQIITREHEPPPRQPPAPLPNPSEAGAAGPKSSPPPIRRRRLHPIAIARARPVVWLLPHAARLMETYPSRAANVLLSAGTALCTLLVQLLPHSDEAASTAALRCLCCIGQSSKRDIEVMIHAEHGIALRAFTSVLTAATTTAAGSGGGSGSGSSLSTAVRSASPSAAGPTKTGSTGNTLRVANVKRVCSIVSNIVTHSPASIRLLLDAGLLVSLITLIRTHSTGSITAAAPAIMIGGSSSARRMLPAAGAAADAGSFLSRTDRKHNPGSSPGAGAGAVAGGGHRRTPSVTSASFTVAQQRELVLETGSALLTVMNAASYHQQTGLVRSLVVHDRVLHVLSALIHPLTDANLLLKLLNTFRSLLVVPPPPSASESSPGDHPHLSGAHSSLTRPGAVLAHAPSMASLGHHKRIGGSDDAVIPSHHHSTTATTPGSLVPISVYGEPESITKRMFPVRVLPTEQTPEKSASGSPQSGGVAPFRRSKTFTPGSSASPTPPERFTFDALTSASTRQLGTDSAGAGASTSGGSESLTSRNSLACVSTTEMLSILEAGHATTRLQDIERHTQKSVRNAAAALLTTLGLHSTVRARETAAAAAAAAAAIAAAEKEKAAAAAAAESSKSKKKKKPAPTTYSEWNLQFAPDKAGAKAEPDPDIDGKVAAAAAGGLGGLAAAASILIRKAKTAPPAKPSLYAAHCTVPLHRPAEIGEPTLWSTVAADPVVAFIVFMFSLLIGVIVLTGVLSTARISALPGGGAHHLHPLAEPYALYAEVRDAVLSVPEVVLALPATVSEMRSQLTSDSTGEMLDRFRHLTGFVRSPQLAARPWFDPSRLGPRAVLAWDWTRETISERWHQLLERIEQFRHSPPPQPPVRPSKKKKSASTGAASAAAPAASAVDVPPQAPHPPPPAGQSPADQPSTTQTSAAGVPVPSSAAPLVTSPPPPPPPQPVPPAPPAALSVASPVPTPAPATPSTV